MSFGPGSNALVTDALPPVGDTVEEAINKLDAQLAAVYEGLNSGQIGFDILESEPQASQIEEGEVVFVAPANTDSAFVILNEEPTTSTLAEGQIAFVVEA